jgi:hypothetical protein
MLDKTPNLYIKARNLSLLGALLLLGTSTYFGRIPVFLFLNTDGGIFIDQFFKWSTWGAEGWIWIPFLAIVFGWFKTKTRQFWSVPFVSQNERMVYLEKVKQDIRKDLKS